MTSDIRDVIQVYTQSRTASGCAVHSQPPTEMRLPSEKIPTVVEPLYGIPESGLLFYLTYLNHRCKMLRIFWSRANPCLLYRSGEKGLDVMVIVQIDDGLTIGSKSFLKDGMNGSQAFISKPRPPLRKTVTLFNDLEVAVYEKEDFL